MGKRLYVGNLPYDADEASLRAAFGQDGRSVERVHIVLDRETQRPRGFAFVEMATEEQAQQALEALNGTVFGTRQLRVSVAEDRRPPGGGPGAPRSERPPMGAPRPDGGGGGGGGGARQTEDVPRAHRFGPDARPRHERDREHEHRRGQGRRRGEDDDHGRRGRNRYDEDDDE